MEQRTIEELTHIIAKGLNEGYSTILSECATSTDAEARTWEDWGRAIAALVELGRRAEAQSSPLG